MSEVRKGLGAGAIALVPIACCIGLPLLVAAGVGAAALVWGGAVVGALVIMGLAGLIFVRRRAGAAGGNDGLSVPASPREPASERREEVVQR